MSLNIRELSKSYGDKQLFSGLTLSFGEGITVLRAPSGWGKTTLFRLIAGLEKPDSGTVSCDGKIGYLFQEPRLFPSVSALENVACVSSLPKSEAEALLIRLGIEKTEQKKRPSELSGGMNQRVAIARLLLYARNPEVKVLLLDEPLKGLDPVSRALTLDILFEETRGKTVLVISHESIGGVPEVTLGDGN